MPKLFIEELAAGMELDVPVKDQFGLVLFQKGTALTEKMIQTLKMWGISEVTITSESIGESKPEAASVDPAVYSAISASVGRHFRHSNPSGMFVKELIRHILHRRVTEHLKETADAE
jgi:hypothetical protein